VKLFGFILSFYIIGLNCIPCGDAVAIDGQENIPVILESDQDQYQNEQDKNEADECPPFCECHCCHVHVVDFNPNILPILEPAISTLIIQKGENSGQEIPDFHFQPPRV